jgi:hypothetical protein
MHGLGGAVGGVCQGASILDRRIPFLAGGRVKVVERSVP